MSANSPTTGTRGSDRIEEQVLLRFPRERVWRALTEPKELGAWFGVNLTGATIAPGAHVIAKFTIPGHDHLTFDVVIEEVVPERRFSWRWHPHAIDATADYSKEQRTLVTFTLEDASGGGTVLRVSESGFDTVPAARRDAALLGNSNGWRGQLQKRLPAFLDNSINTKE